MTSSVFNFYSYLKLAKGIPLHPLISPARNWTFYLVYLMMAPNGGGGLHLAGHALMWALMAAGQKEERARAL